MNEKRTGQFLRRIHVVQRRLNSDRNCLRNHLLSIEKDFDIVSSVVSFACKAQESIEEGSKSEKSLNHDPLFFANKRNGVWYAPKSFFTGGTCYFKSTDGHDQTFTFSHTRLNLELAVAATKGGAYIIDSTRSGGKRFPDSMRCTIPIWCAVINSVVLGKNEDHNISWTDNNPWWFEAPPFMSPSLASQIINALPSLIAGVPSTLTSIIRSTLSPCLLLDNTSGPVKRPLRPIWVCPSAASQDLGEREDDTDGLLEWLGESALEFLSIDTNDLPFAPVVMVSCSKARSEEIHRSRCSWSYIQGAGDDDENWAPPGLTSEHFWKHKDEILASDDPVEVERICMDIIGRLNSAYDRDVGGGEGESSVGSLENGLASNEQVFIDHLGVNIVTLPILHHYSNLELEQSFNFKNAIIIRQPTKDTSKNKIFFEKSSSCDGTRNLLVLFAASEKKDSCAQNNLWINNLLPECLKFYKNFSFVDSYAKASAPAIGTCPPFLIIGHDFELPTMVSIVLSFAFDIEPHRYTKDDIHGALVKMNLISTSLSLHRRHIKILNNFFVSPDGPWNREKVFK